MKESSTAGHSYIVKNIETIAEGSDVRARLAGQGVTKFGLRSKAQSRETRNGAKRRIYRASGKASFLG